MKMAQKSLFGNAQANKLQNLKIELTRKKQRQIHQKISRNISKQKHIIEMGVQLQNRLRQKNAQIINKLNKSVELKKNQLEEVKKKWHQRLQYETQKHKAYQRQEKIRIKQLWDSRLSQKYIKSHRYNDIVSENNRIKTEHHHSPLIDHQYERIDTCPRIHRKNNKSDVEKSKVNGIGTRKLMVSLPKPQRQDSEEIDPQKLTKMGQKMKKIKSTRQKRQKLYEERIKKMAQYTEFKQLRKQQMPISKPHTHKRSNTLGAYQNHPKIPCEKARQSSKQQLFKKWEQQNKKKNEELFQQRMAKGEEYMALMKERKQKQKLIKQLENKSIEKKLYLQRMELSKISETKQL